MKERPRLLFLTISPLRAVLYRPNRRQLAVLLCTEPADGTRYGCAYRKRRKDFFSSYTHTTIYRTVAKPIYDWSAAICHKEHMLDDSPLSLLFFFSFSGLFCQMMILLVKLKSAAEFSTRLAAPATPSHRLDWTAAAAAAAGGGGDQVAYFHSSVWTSRNRCKWLQGGGWRKNEATVARLFYSNCNCLRRRRFCVYAVTFPRGGRAEPAFLNLGDTTKDTKNGVFQPRPPSLYIFAVMN